MVSSVGRKTTLSSIMTYLLQLCSFISFIAPRGSSLVCLCTSFPAPFCETALSWCPDTSESPVSPGVSTVSTRWPQVSLQAAGIPARCGSCRQMWFPAVWPRPQVNSPRLHLQSQLVVGQCQLIPWRAKHCLPELCAGLSAAPAALPAFPAQLGIEAGPYHWELDAGCTFSKHTL